MWTSSTGKIDVTDKKKWDKLNTKDGITTHARILGLDTSSMFYYPIEVLRPQYHSHLIGKHMSTPYSSWTPTARLVFGRAKQLIDDYTLPIVFLSIILTKYFTKNDIYHVTDSLKTGFSLTEDAKNLWPHEYFVHGPIEGTGFMTFPISTFQEILGRGGMV